MNNQLLLFFFSLLGAFNGLLLSIYFLVFPKKKHVSNYFLGALLMMLSIRIGKSVFFYFNDDLARIFLQIGLSACFFIGPFLYLYVRSVSSSESKVPWKYLILPLCILVVVGGSWYTYEDYTRLWQYYFYRVINYQWLGFILLSGYYLKDTFKKIFKAKLNYQEVWVLSIYWGVFIIWLGYFVAYYTSYIVGALSFSFVLYLSIFILVFHPGQDESSPSIHKPKYANKKIQASEAENLAQQIEQLMRQEKVYTDANLSLAKLAKKLQISPHILSQFLNDNLNKSFSQFINEYRVEEAKRILKTQKHLKMEIIAEHCGFNSNSTFYAAFKKFTNTTPAKYINNH